MIGNMYATRQLYRNVLKILTIRMIIHQTKCKKYKHDEFNVLKNTMLYTGLINFILQVL